jgi:crotonobetainyl-CoA:carnitine CoA-transferase CaiB-like acyl-CoA transferase
LTKPRAAELAKEIIKISDVVAENFSADTMERFGLGYQDLREIKPDIIFYANSIPGRTGPRRHYAGYAWDSHALSGAASLTGRSDGPPMNIGANYGDLITGTHGAFAILAALHHREKTGKGQYIDASMIEVVVDVIPEAAMDYLMNGKVRQRQGNRHDFMAPHGCYRCRGDDKWVAIAIGSEEEWRAFCGAMGEPEWTKDAKFADGYSRWLNQEELDKLVGTWTKDYTHYEVMEILQRAGVAAGPSLSAAELVEDRHLRQRGFLVEMDHTERGKGPMPGLPWRFLSSPGHDYRAGPCLGEHNDYVFGKLLGLSKDEIAKLVEEEVVY